LAEEKARGLLVPIKNLLVRENDCGSSYFDDRRPTTDDRRPTTDDQRPTTFRPSTAMGG